MASMSSDSSNESWSKLPESKESSNSFAFEGILPFGSFDLGESFGLEVCRGPLASLTPLRKVTTSGLLPLVRFEEADEGLRLGEAIGGSGLLINGLSLVGEFLSGEVGEEREAGGGAGGFPRVPDGVGKGREGDPLLAQVNWAGLGGAVLEDREGRAGGGGSSEGVETPSLPFVGLPVDMCISRRRGDGDLTLLPFMAECREFS